MPAKRVAIVTPVFPPYRGGMGRVAETDALQLSALGYDVRVYAPSLTAARRGVRPYATRRLAGFPRYGLAAFAPQVARYLDEHDVVLLHLPFFGTVEPLALRLALDRALGRRSRGKLVITYHMDVNGSGWLVPLFSAPARWLQPAVLRAADRVLVTSTDYARASSLAPLFAAQPERFRELAPGTDVERFTPGPKDSALLTRYGLTPFDRVVTLVGGLDKAHYFKGVPTLLRALSAADLADVRALIVGDGDLRPGYEAHARQLGVADRVIWAGSVSEEELAAHHRLGDVFAFPSVDRSEAFGIAALEALACGVPVVASDLPGVRTIVREGLTGLLVPAGSASALALALARLLGDEPLRRAMGRDARAMAEAEYSYDVRQAKLGLIMAELL